jgi:hypothetical protein
LQEFSLDFPCSSLGGRLACEITVDDAPPTKLADSLLREAG